MAKRQTADEGANAESVEHDKFLYHLGAIERIDAEAALIRARRKKINTQAAADGIVLQTLRMARKMADLAPEHNTEEQRRLKAYLTFMRQPAGTQMTIADYVQSKGDTKATAFRAGRDAAIKGYGPKDIPYDDPASTEAQSWLEGFHDGAKRRKEIEAGDDEEEGEDQAEAA